MDITELRSKSLDELNDSLLDLKKQLFNLRFQKSSGELENVSLLRTVKRDIARVRTLLNEKVKAS